MKNIIKHSVLILITLSLVWSAGQVFAQSAPIFNPQGSITGGTAPSVCGGGLNDIRGILNFFTCLITQSIIPLLITLAIVYFIYGVVKYIMNANEAAEREEGRKFMIWGIVALFVIVSIWGLVKLLAGTFGFNFVIPQLQQ